MKISTESKIYIAGHKGMVGSAIKNRLEQKGYSNLLYRSSSELDLRNQQKVDGFISENAPEVVIMAAARVGGILANDTYPYQFLLENMQIQNNLIDASFKNGVKKLIFLGSSCIYPKFADQPLTEDSLLTGALEPTNEWYAIAKISGVKLVESLRRQYQMDYVSLMPTNLYGPRDNFDLKTSHVLPAMIRKFHDAKIDQNRPVTLWGSGTPMREFLHVNDLATSVEFVMNKTLSSTLYNIGTGIDISINDLAIIIQKVVGHTGEIVWDKSKPDGTPRKLMDVTKINEEGWQYTIDLYDGIISTYDWFLNNLSNVKEVTITD